MAQIAVIGTGYVGLTTAACFSHLGHHVVAADIDEGKVARLQRGEVPILEAGIEDLVLEGLQQGTLRFVLGAAGAAAEAEFIYLCVPTPQGPDGSADMSYVEAAAREIAPVLPADSVVVNKSTVPVGSAWLVARALERPDVHVVSNPEFLREGSAVQDFLHPDRVVIGSDDQSAAIRVAELYEGIGAPVMVTDPASAETIKYASNAFLATKLSFINAVANVCEAVGADVNDVVLGMGYDKRIGHEFLRPGPGWGGSCFDGRETVLVRRGQRTELVTFSALFDAVDELGPTGWEVLAWGVGDPRPDFHPVSAFTRRPSPGEVIEVRTKMGRRLLVTPDHPFVVSDGRDPERTQVVLAAELTTDHWLPVAQDGPLPGEPDLVVDSLLDAAALPGDQTKRVPDQIWGLPEECRRALLRGLWDGDGSWSLIRGGPSAILEYGTVSRELADGMLRLLGSLGIMASMRTGRTARSTVDTYWLRISGADQVEAGLFLLPDDEAAVVRASIARQAKRIQPTGYRRLGKGVAWVRVVGAERRPHHGDVYSLEVPLVHTVVSTNGLIAHNCFPKDTRAMIRIAEDAGYDFNLLKGVIKVNDEQFDRTADKVVELAGGSLEGVTVAVWGLTFKAGTDDLRESPALEVVQRLLAAGARVRAHDPAVHRAPDGFDVEVVDDPYAACEGASVLVVLTEWDEFRFLDLAKVAGLLAERNVVDARNLLERPALQRHGFTVRGVGWS